jgi:hypothetical protein
MIAKPFDAVDKVAFNSFVKLAKPASKTKAEK